MGGPRFFVTIIYSPCSQFSPTKHSNTTQSTQPQSTQPNKKNSKNRDFEIGKKNWKVPKTLYKPKRRLGLTLNFFVAPPSFLVAHWWD